MQLLSPKLFEFFMEEANIEKVSCKLRTQFKTSKEPVCPCCTQPFLACVLFAGSADCQLLRPGGDARGQHGHYGGTAQEVVRNVSSNSFLNKILCTRLALLIAIYQARAERGLFTN